MSYSRLNACNQTCRCVNCNNEFTLYINRPSNKTWLKINYIIPKNNACVICKTCRSCCQNPIVCHDCGSFDVCETCYNASDINIPLRYCECDLVMTPVTAGAKTLTRDVCHSLICFRCQYHSEHVFTELARMPQRVSTDAPLLSTLLTAENNGLFKHYSYLYHKQHHPEHAIDEHYDSEVDDFMSAGLEDCLDEVYFSFRCLYRHLKPMFMATTSDKHVRLVSLCNILKHFDGYLSERASTKNFSVKNFIWRDERNSRTLFEAYIFNHKYSHKFGTMMIEFAKNDLVATAEEF